MKPTTPSTEQDWQKQFDERFRHIMWFDTDAHTVDPVREAVKKFISDLLATQRTELVERVKKLDDLAEIEDTSERTHD